VTGGPEGSEGQQKRNREERSCAAAGVGESHNTDPPAQGRGEDTDDGQGPFGSLSKVDDGRPAARFPEVFGRTGSVPARDQKRSKGQENGNAEEYCCTASAVYETGQTDPPAQGGSKPADQEQGLPQILSGTNRIGTGAAHRHSPQKTSRASGSITAPILVLGETRSRRRAGSKNFTTVMYLTRRSPMK
jgi:hypothetical protein